MLATLQPHVLRWARERAGLSDDDLARRLRIAPDRVRRWEANGQLALTQAEKLATVTRTPLGYLFLARPPVEELPIPDFRTMDGAAVRKPSPDLLDTIQAMQRRQAWMRDELIERGHAPLPFVGGASQRDLPRAVAATIRRRLALTDGWAANTAGVEAALSELREKIESVGVLIVVNGVVGNNTHRKLDPTEFRGFALVDGHAPLIFVNGADAKSAQMFTFAHELAHIWLGEAGVSDLDPLRPDVGPSGSVEALCNAAAAELVVPEAELRARWAHAAAQQEPYRVLARAFKVSPIVCARRALETDLITREAFFAFYEAQARDLASASRKSTGGHFWNTQNVRVGKRFGAAVVAATREGRLLYHEAYRLTDLRGETFEKFARSLGY